MKSESALQTIMDWNNSISTKPKRQKGGGKGGKDGKGKGGKGNLAYQGGKGKGGKSNAAPPAARPPPVAAMQGRLSALFVTYHQAKAATALTHIAEQIAMLQAEVAKAGQSAVDAEFPGMDRHYAELQVAFEASALRLQQYSDDDTSRPKRLCQQTLSEDGQGLVARRIAATAAATVGRSHGGATAPASAAARSAPTISKLLSF
jgi:hypothetical protein